MSNLNTKTLTNKNKNYAGAAHPMSDEIRRQAQHRMKQLPKRARFGDKRDAYIAALNTKNPLDNPCTSKGLSTMPSRAR